MRKVPSISLLVKLPLIFSVTVVAVAATIGVAMVALDRQRLTERLMEQALLQARSVAVIAPEPLLRGDSWGLHKALRQLSLGRDGERDAILITAMVLDPQGRVLAHTDPARFPIGLPVQDQDPDEAIGLQAALSVKGATATLGSGFIEGIAPIQSSGRMLGVARLRLSTAELDKTMADASRLVLFLTAGMALVGSFVGLGWSVSALKPLKELAGSMAELGRGRARPLSVTRGDEIGELVAQFNRMAEELDEKRRLARELAANEKMIALGRIAAGVAHEVNNPLAGMLNCLSTLHARSNDPALVARYLPLIEKGLRRIEALVKDLLIELRAEDTQEIADASCIDDLYDLIVAEVDPKKIDISWINKLASSDCVNPFKMQQILLNLMRNAVQAMPEGGRLMCRFHDQDEQQVFEIEDTGHGIRHEDMAHIFDPFFTSRQTGTGLGLWIVLRLVQSMYGTVEVESAPGRGALFRVSIPRETTRVPEPA